MGLQRAGDDWVGHDAHTHQNTTDLVTYKPQEFPTALGAGGLRLGCQCGRVLVRALLQVADCRLVALCSHGGRQRGRKLSPNSGKSMKPTIGLQLHGLRQSNHVPRPHCLTLLHRGLGFQHIHLGHSGQRHSAQSTRWVRAVGWLLPRLLSCPPPQPPELWETPVVYKLPGLCYSDVCVYHVQLIPVQLFGTSWTVAHQAPVPLGFSRQEYWSGLPFPPPGHLPHPGTKPEGYMGFVHLRLSKTRIREHTEVRSARFLPSDALWAWRLNTAFFCHFWTPA